MWEVLPPSANPTNAAIEVPTALIGLAPEATSSTYTFRASFTRLRPLSVATTYTATPSTTTTFASRVTLASSSPWRERNPDPRASTTIADTRGVESTIERDDVRLLATPAQVERALGISRKTLNRLVEQGVLRPVRLVPGGNRRFRWSDLSALVEATNDEEED